MPMPPSTLMTWPVMNRASSLSSNGDAPAMSSGLPSVGVTALRSNISICSAGTFAASAGVSTTPGATALQRMPCLP